MLSERRIQLWIVHKLTARILLPLVNAGDGYLAGPLGILVLTINYAPLILINAGPS